MTDLHPAVELTRAFYAFEARGRGADSFNHLVELEPTFIPIPGRHPDDLYRGSDEAEYRKRHTFRLTSTPDYRGDLRQSEAALSSLAHLNAPITFECGRLGGEHFALWSAAEEDELFLSLLTTEPGLELTPDRGLAEHLEALPERYALPIAFALSREWMLPLSERPLLPDLLSLLDRLPAEDCVVLQVTFAPARMPWQEAGRVALLTPRGEPFFQDEPDFARRTGGKLAGPLLAVSVRVLCLSSDNDRLARLAPPVAGLLSRGGGENALLPVAVDPELEIPAFPLGLSTRTGMLLSPGEVAALIHPPAGYFLPAATVPSSLRDSGLTIGITPSGEEVSLKLSARLRHTHVIGASGTGKSTLLLRMILADIEAGHGLALIDPHGDLADAVLALFPEEESDRLVVFDPSEREYVLGFNPLEARSEREREILSSDLVAVFRRLSTSWGDQMTAVLSYAVLGVLTSGGGTLEDLRRFLSRPEERKRILQRADPFVREFFESDFKHLKGRPEAPILTRLNTLLRVPLLRDLFMERERTLDLPDIISGRRILIARLGKGAIGAENASLLASLLVSRLHQAAFMRDELPEERRHPFFVYIDEVHNALSPSLDEIFSGARKYALGMTVAHQSLSQLDGRDRDMLRSLLANAYTRIAFRLGEDDARLLARSFGGVSADELLDLETGEAVVRSGRARDTVLVETENLDRPTTAERERGRRRRLSALRRHGRQRREVRATEAPEPLPEPPQTRQKSEPAPPEPPQAPGHGGAEHRYLQGLVMEWGRSRGFEVRLEEAVLDGRGRVDVGLHKKNRRLAVEIAITTDRHHEEGNVRKCLEAGFDEVVLVSTNKPLLEALREVFAGDSRTHFLSPQGLFGFLRDEPEETGTVAGYRVTVTGGDERQGSALRDVLARNLKRLSEKKR